MLHCGAPVCTAHFGGGRSRSPSSRRSTSSACRSGRTCRLSRRGQRTQCRAGGRPRCGKGRSVGSVSERGRASSRSTMTAPTLR
eukprot:7424859-Alexandrium_andersonii.AAC.1